MATIEANRLESLRRARGLSQRTLAEAAGVTRQAVGAIESGRMQPSVGIALGLAHALGTTVEELFAPSPELPRNPQRVAAATIAGRLVSHALTDDHLAIEPAESPVPNVFVAGCDLAIGLLARHATARSANARVLWLKMTNRAALAALVRGEVHAAVVHGDVTALRRSLRGNFVGFELATTEAGWLFLGGNPLRLRGAADLLRAKARLANRPSGAGARHLLDEQLRHANIDPRRIAGYDRVLAGQMDTGRAIAQGFADAAVGMASVARSFDLHFLPLRSERCVLVVSQAATHTSETRSLLDALRSAPYRRDLEALHSYDITRTGELIA